MIERYDVDGSKHPNFISCWMLRDTYICDDMIEFFEGNEDLQVSGLGTFKAGKAVVDKTVKDSTDLQISPSDLKDEKFHAVSAYMEILMGCYSDYLEQWDFLKSFLSRVHVGGFKIQKYDEGGHFKKLHSERTSLNYLHRTLVWMTYLNDVQDGGETEFPMFGVKVKPEKGKTLVWPAEWTHAHLGAVVKKGEKYIITGWMHFPDDM